MPTKIEVNKISNKTLKCIPLLNLINFPNINNKVQNKIIKKDLNNSFIKLWLIKLNFNFTKPKLFHIFSWFHLFFPHIFKKDINKINIKMYSLPFKKGKKNESNKVDKFPRI